jgi:DNA invertase Pin-like site-specific DNA recombinase
MSAAAAILEGMPDPRDLRRLDTGGETVIFAGSAELFRFAADDTAMRHVAAAVLRQLKFPGKDVAAVLGLSAAYVATLHQRALREGTAALVRPAGRPRETGEAAWDRAREWRAAGVRDAEIARRLGVNQSTVLRRLGREHVQDLLPQAEPEPEDAEAAVPEPGSRPGPAGPVPPGPVPPAGDGQQPAEPVTVRSRYAGAMLLHAFASRAGAGEIFRAAAGQDAAPQDVALLAAVSACFALGAATTEQFKHLAAAEAGPLAGLSWLPGLRTLRPRLAAVADRADPLELQRMFAQAMLDADPVASGVYYVDDHFVPYTGAKPVGKGWNNKRGRAGRGRADTHITAHDGRAVCFVTGEPSGLTATLPKALAELKKTLTDGAKIMLGFDRGGAYPQVFTHCRKQDVHWVTYRRAPLAVPAMLPVITTATIGGRQRTITWAEEKVQLKDYGEARQLTLFEHGRVVLQILTSDFDACPADILAWLKSRWREENFLKYASVNYGIDKICDYAAAIEVNTKITANPARKTANTRARRAENELAAAERALAALLSDPDTTAAAKNAAIPAAERAISTARRNLREAAAARDGIPAKLPADQIDPDARTAVLRTGRRGLQMVLRLLAHNAEHWLATHLNAYLRDDDEYRAATRATIIRGLAGTITFTPAAITVTLQAPAEPRLARALALLTDEINAQPPAIPGDSRPITYRIHPQPRI